MLRLLSFSVMAPGSVQNECLADHARESRKPGFWASTLAAAGHQCLITVMPARAQVAAMTTGERTRD
jgi:hypothetical protein